METRIEIRDTRNGEWFWVNKTVWKDRKLNASDKVLYGTLAFFANNKTQECFPSFTKLGEFSDLSRPTIAQSLQKLVKLHYLKVEKTRGKVNTYLLVKIFNQSVLTSKKETIHQSNGLTSPTPRLVKKTTTNKKDLYNNKGILLLKSKMKNLGLRKT